MKVKLIKTKEDDCYEYYDKIVDDHFYCVTLKWKGVKPVISLLGKHNGIMDDELLDMMEKEYGLR